MYGFGGVGLSEVQISISELSVVGGWWWTGQMHFMVGPSQGPTKREKIRIRITLVSQKDKKTEIEQSSKKRSFLPSG